MTDLRAAAQQALEAEAFKAEEATQWRKFTDQERIAFRAGFFRGLAEPSRAQQMRDAGYTRRPTLREMADPVQEPTAHSPCPPTARTVGALPTSGTWPNTSTIAEGRSGREAERRIEPTRRREAMNNEQTPKVDEGRRSTSEVGHMDNCSHCGFPLPRNGSGLRHYGTHTAHQESECLRLLHAEIAGLKDAVRLAKADEARRWTSRVDGLTAQLRELDSRYMALIKSVADGQAMQPRTVLLEAPITKPETTEPFGYFRAEPFGWTDCAPTDEGAIPLYERPPTPPEAQTEAEKVAYCAGWWDALAKKREQK